MYALEKDLNKTIRSAAKRDRFKWFDDMLQSGDWSAVERVGKGFAPKQGSSPAIFIKKRNVFTNRDLAKVKPHILKI